MSSGTPAARVGFTDLSKYAGPSLELFGPSSDCIRLEASSSPVDPGEDHEKVRLSSDHWCCGVFGFYYEAQLVTFHVVRN